MADKHESKTKKPMAAHEKRDFNQLDDFLFTVAESIEEAFLRAGAQPGKDYHWRATPSGQPGKASEEHEKSATNAAAANPTAQAAP